MKKESWIAHEDFEHEDSAKELTRAIAERWGEGAESFDIEDWLKE